MIYSELNKGAQNINKFEKLLEKTTNKIKQEKSNSRTIQLQNEGYKEFIINLGVDPSDKAAIDVIIEGSQSEIQPLRSKLKMPTIEHVQTKELAQVENEKEIFAKELIERKN